MYKKIAEELIKFIDKSPSCYHVIENFRTMLLEKGYQELWEEENWTLKQGGNYFVTRNGSSMIAFKVPTETPCNYQIVASHSDSPTFKIKEDPEMLISKHYVELNVEKYGGMLYSPWLDRPLSVAGRVMIKEDGAIKQKLVNVDRDLLVIPNLAIHMNRKANEGYKMNPQKDLIPLFGDEMAKGKFSAIIAEAAGVSEDAIVASDLFLYNRVSGTIWGASEEYISSAKLDDLQCAYSTMQGFMAGENKESISVCCVFDNEEVGSETKQGAASSMLQDTLERICEALGGTRETYRRLIASSFMLSADNAHAVHPNYAEKADPVNKPYMNHGIVIKHNANQKYTTDAVSSAIFKEICKRAKVPVQNYINRSDIAGGSTLGNIANTHVSLNTVDIGLAQLAMHSPYETAGIKDTTYMIKAVKTFYDACIKKRGMEFYI